MQLVRYLLGQSRWRLVLAIVSGFASGAMTTALVAIINAAINPEASFMPVQWLPWAFGILFIGVPVARLASQYLLVGLGQNIVHDLRISLSRRLARTPLRRIEELRPHRLLATLTEDVNTLGFSVVMIPGLTVNVAIVVGCLTYLGWLSWPLLVGFIVLMIFAGIGYRVPLRKGGNYFVEAREEQDALMGRFETLIEGNKELKLHSNRRLAFFDRLRQVAGRLRDFHIRGSLVFTAANSVGWSFFFLVLGLILFGLPMFHEIDRATLTGYVLVILYLRGPMQMLFDSLPNLSRGSVALRKIESLDLALEEAQEKEAKEKGKTAKQLAASTQAPFERLELAGVEYTYTTESGAAGFSVGPVDLHFEAGEMVFIVGGNGSGKTTFAKILTGLYLPQEGQLRVNGEPIGEGQQDLYRNQFSVVFSSFFLFDELLGLDAEGLDKRATEYLETLQLDSKVTVDGGRLSTTDLSQGQRKRLALLTAYLEDRPVYLFDEWAADQDPHFRRFFYRELLPELKARGKTLLIISHDDAYYDVADRIIKLDFGKIVYDGPVGPFLGTRDED